METRSEVGNVRQNVRSLLEVKAVEPSIVIRSILTKMGYDTPTIDKALSPPPDTATAHDFYEQQFELAYPEPISSYEEFTSKYSPVLHDHVALVLDTTNRIRTAITSGILDHLPAETVFHLIHFIHAGMNDPVKTALAVANYRTIESWTAYAYWNQTCLDAFEIGEDPSMQLGRLRSTPIRWRDKDSGIIGIHEDDLGIFSQKMFKKINTFIEWAQTHPEFSENRDAVITFSVTAATLLDIAHLKKDLNGRACEDFMVWMQKQLSNGKHYAFVSDTGLRAPGAERIVEDWCKEKIEIQRMRINNRNNLVVNIRSWIFDVLAYANKMKPNDLEKLWLSGKPEDREKKQDIRHQAEKRLYDNISGMYPKYPQSFSENQFYDCFKKLIEFYKTFGVSKYTSIDPAVGVKHKEMEPYM